MPRTLGLGGPVGCADATQNTGPLVAFRPQRVERCAHGDGRRKRTLARHPALDLSRLPGSSYPQGEA